MSNPQSSTDDRNLALSPRRGVKRMKLFTGTHRARPATPDVDIGLIYTHEDSYMPRLLSTLRDSAGDLGARLILVDNDSQRGVEPWLNCLPDTKVLRNSNRLFYTANLNRILEASRAPYVLLLNTDMYFDPREQCVAQMVRFMRSHPECGVAGCRLYHADGGRAHSARRFQTVSIVLARRFGLGRMLNGTLADYFYQEQDPLKSWDCDWLSGCFLMLRRDAIEEVGSFDTGFVKYFEDVDMCLRMARAGWGVMYHGGTYCYHLEQRSSKNLFSADACKHARSYLRWLRKWGFSPAKHLPETVQRRKAA